MGFPNEDATKNESGEKTCGEKFPEMSPSTTFQRIMHKRDR
jgi:hypothetical protein